MKEKIFSKGFLTQNLLEDDRGREEVENGLERREREEREEREKKERRERIEW